MCTYVVVARTTEKERWWQVDRGPPRSVRLLCGVTLFESVDDKLTTTIARDPMQVIYCRPFKLLIRI